MQHLTIVAHIHATPEGVDLVEAELRKLVPLTRAEEGCVRYDLHRDDQDPTHFLFHETWESRALWQAHIASDHITAYRKVVEGAIAEFRLHELTQIA